MPLPEGLHLLFQPSQSSMSAMRWEGLEVFCQDLTFRQGITQSFVKTRWVALLASCAFHLLSRSTLSQKNTHYFGLKSCRQQQQHVTNRRWTQKNMFPQQNKKVVTTKKTFGGPPNHNQHTNQQQLFPKKALSW